MLMVRIIVNIIRKIIEYFLIYHSHSISDTTIFSRVLIQAPYFIKILFIKLFYIADISLIISEMYIGLIITITLTIYLTPIPCENSYDFTFFFGKPYTIFRFLVFFPMYSLIMVVL